MPQKAKTLQVKSLQEIAAAKTIQTIRGDRKSAKIITKLSDEQQQVLVPYILSDYIKTLDFQRKNETYQQRRDYFRSQWIQWCEEDGLPARASTRWDQWQLVKTSSRETPIELCCCWEQDWRDRCNKAGVFLGRLLPARQLFRRVVTGFGLPEKTPFSETRCQIALAHREDPDSVLRFVSHHGSSGWGSFDISFEGQKGLAIAALEMLNWLLSVEVPSPFRPVLANTRANEKDYWLAANYNGEGERW
ncbi:hypothetical protein H2200_012190 [Cladophialophora chaetospira]|uniref:Uncharacterized protein n=1 Tax=Cladophialophora chaetospira TaxID=386627 RepID=A0AA39CCN3_9EURO|nr:hypothetical protein H2200_012190 [Cladophialophora chaetospira]